MAVDRGELRYRINVTGELDKLRELRERLLQARRAFRRFRDDAKGLSSDTRSVSTSMKDLGKATERAVGAQRRALNLLRTARRDTQAATTAARRQTRQLTQQRRETEKLTDRQKELLGLARRLRQAQRQGDSRIQKLRTEVAVRERINRAVQQLAVSERLAAAGRDIRTGQSTEERERLELLRAQQDVQQAQARLQNTELRDLEAELAVSRKILDVQKRQAIERRLAAENRLPSGLTFEETAFANLQKELQGLELRKTQEELARTNPEFQRLTNRANQLRESLGEARTNNRTFREGLRRTQSQANRVFFTFRRLIGIFAAFQALRLSANVFREVIAGAVRFNAFLEQARLGMASLFLATGEVRDVTGESVGQMQQFVLAQKEARRQEQLLRRDALQTVATFEQLLDTFQVAIAPGVQSGLDIDQIRQFTVRISQAAGAIGVAQNQLAEEIRSILAGTIQLRTTRIAAALGIRNEDIRNAKEAGELFEFLQDRFEAFGIAGAEALNTFGGILNRVKDGFQLILSQGSIEFFDELKGLLNDIFDTIVTETPEGLFEPSPQALTVVQRIGEGLRRAVAAARDLRDRLSFGDALATANTVGSVIGGIAEGFVEIVDGFIRGLRRVASTTRGIRRIFDPVVQQIKNLFPEDESQSFLSRIVEIGTVLVSISVAFKTIGFLVGALVTPINIFLGAWARIRVIGLFLSGTIFPAIQAAAAAIGTSVAGLVIVFGGLVIAATTIFDEFTGIELKLGTIIRLVRIGLTSAFKFVAAYLRLVFTGAIVGIENGVRTIIFGIREFVLATTRVILRVIGIFSKKARETVKELQKVSAQNRQDFGLDLVEGADKIGAAFNNLKDTTIDLFETVPKEIKDALDDNATAKTVEDYANDIKNAFNGTFEVSDPTSILQGQFATADGAAAALLEKVDGLPLIISAGSREVSGFTERMKELREASENSADELRKVAETVGATDPTIAIREAFLDNEFEIRKKTLEIENELDNLRLQRITQERELIRIQREASDIGSSGEVAELTDLIQEQRALQNERSSAELRLKDIERERQRAAAQADQERLSALDEEEAKLSSQISSLDRQIRGLQDESQVVLSNVVSRGAEAAEKATELALRRVTAEGLIKDIGERTNAVTAQGVELQEEANKVLADRIRIARLLQEEENRGELDVLRTEVEGRQRIQAAASRFGIQTRREELAIAQAEAALEEARFRQAQGRLRNERQVAEANLRSAETLIELETQRLELKRQEVAEGKASQEEQDAAAERLARAEESRRIVIASQSEQEALLTAELENQLLILDEQLEKARQLQEQKDNPLGTGISAGFAQFEENATNTFEQVRTITEDFLTGLSETLANGIIEAFDPANNQTIVERLGAFVRSLAQQVLTAAIQQTIARLIASFSSGPSQVSDQARLAREEALQTRKEIFLISQQQLAATQASTAALEESAAIKNAATAPILGTAAGTLVGAAGGLAAAAPLIGGSAVLMKDAADRMIVAALLLIVANGGGGAVGGGGGAGAFRGGAISKLAAISRASEAHIGAQGYAGGGGIRNRPAAKRPKGLHPSDRIPIWAAAGEFMQRAKAVALYGADFMESVNNMQANPVAVRAAAGLSGKMSSVRRPSGPGFVAGGLISDNVAKGTGLAERQVSASESFPTALRAYVVSDEETMDSLLAGGDASMRRFNEENSDERR